MEVNDCRDTNQGKNAKVGSGSVAVLVKQLAADKDCQGPKEKVLTRSLDQISPSVNALRAELVDAHANDIRNSPKTEIDAKRNNPPAECVTGADDFKDDFGKPEQRGHGC